MILIDFSSLSHRIIFATISQLQRNGEIPSLPKGEKYDMTTLTPFFLHLLFSNLKSTKDLALSDEEIILCLDSSSWRKDYYPEYKGHRAQLRDETNVPWEDFYKVVNEATDNIKENFPFRVLKVDKAEGDDLIAIATKKYYNTEDRIYIITEDKDMKQLLQYPNVVIYRPIQKCYVTSDKDELKSWMIEHVLLGDAGDGVPTIKFETEFTNEFKEYLKENNISEEYHIVHEFYTLENYQELLDNYTGVDKYGKNNTFKAPGFGPKTAEKFAEGNSFDLYRKLKENKLWLKNFIRNRRLVQFKFIPKPLIKNIEDALVEVLSVPQGYNKELILEYYSRFNLNKLSSEVNDLLNVNIIEESSLDAWF